MVKFYVICALLVFTFTSIHGFTSESDELENYVDEPTVLERAHWCRMKNGTFVNYGAKFIHNLCTACECTPSRMIRCVPYQCLPAYCIDGSRPHRKEGECCAQCANDPATNSCNYNGTTYPNGVVMKTVGNAMQCWCHQGNIECRQFIGSLFQSLDVLADGAVLTMIGFVLFIILTFGMLMCCGCTIFIYYSYNQNQIMLQQTFDQYFDAGGWEPVEEEQYVIDDGAEEKHLEAEKSQLGVIKADVPPTYGGHNN